MGWTAQRLPDLSGRTAVVTGGNSGVGFQTARELARHGARVVLACRNLDSAKLAADRIGTPHVTTAELDLASMESVRAFGSSWHGPLHLLVNNAGVMAPARFTTTVDGFEQQFGTNHLGHFVLTGLLLPALRETGDARVVTLSSIAHHGGTEAVLEGNAGEGYHPFRTYQNSKLANLLFALQLHRELTARSLPVTSTAAHPGVAATNLFTSREGMGSKRVVRLAGPVLLKAFTQSASAGARSTLFAAVEADPGSYTGPRGIRETRGAVGSAKVSRTAQDEALAKQLWRTSEELTGFQYEW